MVPHIQVACAVITENGRLFAARRGPSRRNAGRWELPGGKLEAGETARACIVRECREELGFDVEPVEEWAPVRYEEPDLNLTLIPVVCRIANGTPMPTEHDATGWFSADELRKLDWSPADIPVIERWITAFTAPGAGSPCGPTRSPTRPDEKGCPSGHRREAGDGTAPPPFPAVRGNAPGPSPR